MSLRRQPILLLLLLLLPSLVRAADPSPSRQLELSRRLLEAEGERDALSFEERIARQGKLPEAIRADLQDAVPKLNRIGDRLDTTHRARLEALTNLAKEVGAERDRALVLWSETAARVLELQERRETFERQRDRAATAAGFFDTAMILSLVWGIVVLLTAIGLTLHERRTDLRRWRRASKTIALLLGIGLTASLHALETEDSVEVRLEIVQAEIADLKAKLHELRKPHLEAWSRLLGRVGEVSDGPHVKKWSDREEEAMDRLHAILAAGFTTKRALAEADRLLGETQREREELSRVSLRSRLSGIGITVLRTGVCALFVVGPLGLLWWTRRSMRQRLSEEARTCPRCLARDTLQLRKSPRQDPLYPDARHVECTRCSHEFRERFRRLPRICYPTVGIRNSGKTRWLGTTYLQVMNTQTPKGAVLQAAPSLAEQQQFGEVLRQILDAEHTDPTVHDVYLPSPLTLHLEDRDNLGHRQALVNLFDFSGEVMNRSIDVDQLRCRALLMDGFVLFLDPTQVQDGMLEQQRDAIRRFHDDLRDLRKLDVDAAVKTPVAVCLSRLDLMLNDSPFGPVSGPWMDQLRQSLHAPRTPETLRERSRLCEEALPFMFQGWDVGRELRERFGQAVMFFPVSSVGLHAEGLNAHEPFGLFEPLLWLLHRQGYCVLDESS